MTVRALMRRHREAQGWSARKLSLAADLSDSMVGKIESGEVQPSLRVFAALTVELQLNQREIAFLVRLAAADTPRRDRR